MSNFRISPFLLSPIWWFQAPQNQRETIIPFPGMKNNQSDPHGCLSGYSWMCIEIMKFIAMDMDDSSLMFIRCPKIVA